MIAQKTRQEKGCMEFYFMLDLENENTIHIEQRWEQRTDLENYIHSDLFKTLIGAIQVLAQSYEFRINESQRAEKIETFHTVQSNKDIQ